MLHGILIPLLLWFVVAPMLLCVYLRLCRVRLVVPSLEEAPFPSNRVVHARPSTLWAANDTQIGVWWKQGAPQVPAVQAGESRRGAFELEAMRD
ncbi:hypothetical protein FB45DRAFT_387126 [Roridomyces roridus]|uniref:Uncharacterized protein n=1 Tax=Roridomyces roridus TaxID=1738132 RepID=A0AAD7B306_9AGAR|nr:hypothetical protein FB45DRAFT_387126 [Roridomyces roridus]